ncbi:MAG: polysaccharide biosynthesis/export family protein [Acidobacteria bacterium]|nr:polysaccharide biosynthesis/export family protein [Acidobacteriota bacterium]
MHRVSVLIVVVCLGLHHVALAQKRSGDKEIKESAPQPGVSEAAPVKSPQWLDYRVGAGDTLEIEVVEHPELSQTLKVSSSGKINLLPVGEIHVEDLTANELETRIAAILEQKDLLRRPEVLVYVRDYQAKRVYLSGEFVRPGEFIMSQHLTVSDAIFLAGGLGLYPDRYGYLHRRLSKGDPPGPPSASIIERPEVPREGTEIVKIDLQPLQEGRTPEPDPPLRGGDYLIVPRRQVEFYFVLGEVLRPLNYPLPDGQPLFISRAISSAGGPTPTAKMSNGLLIRTDKQGKRQEIKIDYAAVLSGRQKDFEVQPNDIIFIPGSKIRTITEGFVQAASGSVLVAALRAERAYRIPERGSDAAASSVPYIPYVP